MKTLFFFITVAVMFSVTTQCGRDSRGDADVPMRGICAHRGAMDTHPENTITAFKEAIRLGAHMIELDVRMTKDGQLVILHDESVDRTTNGTGQVAALTLADVRQLDAGSRLSPEFKGERIPTLKEALATMPHNIRLNIHLKGGFELGVHVAKVVTENKREQQALLACGYEAAAGAKSVNKTIKICNMERQTETADYVSQTIQRKAEFIQFYKTPIDADLIRSIEQLKQHGIKINYCCTDDKKTIQKLFELGVDYVLVNHLESALQVADSLGISRTAID